MEATRNATTGSSSHTHGEYRETYQRDETDNVGIRAVRTKVLHYFHSSRPLHSLMSRGEDETLTRGRERRERSSASALQHNWTDLDQHEFMEIEK